MMFPLGPRAPPAQCGDSGRGHPKATQVLSPRSKSTLVTSAASSFKGLVGLQVPWGTRGRSRRNEVTNLMEQRTLYCE